MKVPFVDLKREFVPLKKDFFEGLEKIFTKMQLTLGENITQFETAFSQYIGTRHSITVASGTDALSLALQALNIQPGDEIITVPNTFFATAEAIIKVGAIPVLADIDPKTLLMSTSNLKKCLSSKTKAIIVVHLYGQMPPMDQLLNFCKEHKLLLIEDAAQAHGSSYQGKKAGNWGDLGCFSFYVTKNLGAYGEGGCVTTNQDTLAECLRCLRHHGQKEKNTHYYWGTNSRMDEMQAFILNLKLKHLEETNEKRKKIANVYNSELQSTPLVLPFQDDPNLETIPYVYVVRTQKRNELKAFLKKQNIDTQIHYPIPIHHQPIFKQSFKEIPSLPNAEKAAQEILSLPFFPELTGDEQSYVIKEIKKFFS